LNTLPHRPRFLIIGPGKAGKDALAKAMVQVAELTRAQSSSEYLMEFVYQEYITLTGNSPHYGCARDFWNDRDKFRTLWKDAMVKYNQPNADKLAREILERNQIYTGLRTRREYDACANSMLFDLIIWVKRDSAPFDESLELNERDADITIDNNGKEYELVYKCQRIFRMMGLRREY
jgi:hypothetical protein